MKVLITGAAGFIASHLIDRLLAAGHEVLGIDNLKLGRRENLAAAMGKTAFRLQIADITDAESLSSIVAEEMKVRAIDCVWHLAANSDIRAGGQDFDVDMRDTFMTTHVLLKVLRQYGIRKIAFASTSAIYGDRGSLLTEDIGPLFPISYYGAMKLASEAAISAALESYLDTAWIFRFPNVIGSRATHGAIFDFVQKLRRNSTELEVLGDGSQEKPYLHVSDLVDAMLYIVNNSHLKLNYYNIGSDGSVSTVKFIADTVRKVVSPEAQIRFTGGNRGWVGDVPKFNYSTRKLSEIGWRAHFSSNGAVEKAVREIASEF
ncbi:MAG: NAD-dependent epimerase/dehydratase family protein [Armatimonadota bacterium]|nr:NAD-dependent epimerase/dehydratase family protein [Armatimonadota bacterium]